MAEYLYACQIDVRFPTAFQAETAMRVMQVDLEPGDRILKAFCLVTPSNNISDGASGAASNNNEKGGEDKEKSILRVDLKATEAKMLRVAASTFYDYLQVVLKTFQEFDELKDKTLSSD